MESPEAGRSRPGPGGLREFAQRLTGVYADELLPAAVRAREDGLDDALRNTFPASDPVCLTPIPNRAPKA